MNTQFAEIAEPKTKTQRHKVVIIDGKATIDPLGMRAFELTENVRDLNVSLINQYGILWRKEASQPNPDISLIEKSKQKIKIYRDMLDSSYGKETLADLEDFNEWLIAEYKILRLEIDKQDLKYGFE